MKNAQHINIFSKSIIENIIAFILGCTVSFLGLINKETYIYNNRVTIACWVILIGVVCLIINSLYKSIGQYVRLKTFADKFYNLQNNMYFLEFVERKYILDRPHVTYFLKMKVRNHADIPLSTIDIKIQAENDSKGVIEEPNIILQNLQINNEDVVSEHNGRIINSHFITDPKRSGKILEQVIRLPLSNDGALQPNQYSTITAVFKLENCLPDESVQDSLFFEIPYLTKRMSINMESKNGTNIILSPSLECPNSVGAYTRYGATIDPDETKNISAPKQKTNGITWEIRKPVLGYNYRLNFKLEKK